MVRIMFRSPDGSDVECEANSGQTIMEVARDNNIRGIEAECGGALSCGTCHVYVDAPAGGAMPEVSEGEGDMLETVAAERRENSRLACQVAITAELSGMVVELPTTQF
ncbi:(2Fe-2S) ferredoxin [Burkholderia lata]|uniref:(2Fe-2S) ferredoxin n=1 Tax=Burkholderia lata (strain ATCC 17760 / DSM 23089 / LMG 22485 / NCIMB 9086 / R18194 / 383) TaxID=482957 RepID=A0A6P2VB25_BURL3|nr:2Fe-2S iron-sulfur cluster-binding protein [Burkholderia lata]VWC76433.1 (2Fe-2S) ferredoxin [Burkholderia lata]